MVNFHSACEMWPNLLLPDESEGINNLIVRMDAAPYSGKTLATRTELFYNFLERVNRLNSEKIREKDLVKLLCEWFCRTGLHGSVEIELKFGFCSTKGKLGMNVDI